MLHLHSVRTLAVLALLAGIAVGCRGEAPTPGGAFGTATSGPTPTPTPTPSPAPEPIEPVVTLETVRVSNAPDVFRRAPEHEIDTAAVDRFTSRVKAWLDGHLLDLREGGGGLLEAVAADQLLDRPDADALAAVTTRLVPPSADIVAVSYDIQVAADGPPEWLVVTVETTASDGSIRLAHFVFVPSDEGPRLVAAGPGDAA